MIHSHLELKNISHRFGSNVSLPNTLDSIDLSIQHGELIGLLGPSGSGKTTLLRLIAGFEKPANGIISLNGREIASAKRLIPPERRGIGMVFQDYALFPHLDVFLNVSFGMPKGSNENRVNWLLELLGIYEFRHRYPHEISGGQRQRVALARALAPGNSIVLLDEPFCSLDVEVRERLRNELSSVLRTCRTTGLLVTHDPYEALAICDRIAVLNEGKLHQFSTPKELVRNPLTAFVGKFVFQKNILNIYNENNIYKTPIGLITTNVNHHGVTPSICMFDINDVQLSLSDKGEYTIISKEFRHDKWILTIKVNKYFIRISHPLEEIISVGDRCILNFKKGNEARLFPGSITCLLG